MDYILNKLHLFCSVAFLKNEFVHYFCVNSFITDVFKMAIIYLLYSILNLNNFLYFIIKKLNFSAEQFTTVLSTASSLKSCPSALPAMTVTLKECATITTMASLTASMTCSPSGSRRQGLR